MLNGTEIRGLKPRHHCRGLGEPICSAWLESRVALLLMPGCDKWVSLTWAGWETQRVPHLEYGYQSPLPRDPRKTWHRKQSSPPPAHTEKGRRGNPSAFYLFPQAFTGCLPYLTPISGPLISCCVESGLFDLGNIQNNVVVIVGERCVWTHLVCRDPFRFAGGTNNEVNICHLFIIEH